MSSTENSKAIEQHSRRIGVLLTNLGTPDAPTAKALRIYLKEFLWDPRVVQIPRIIWWLILHLFILPFRPKKSARLYQSIWTDKGSPLLFHTREITHELSTQLKNKWGDQLVVDYAMRYGSDSIHEKIGDLINNDISHLLILPLYPQYSETTTASTLDKVLATITTHATRPEMQFIDNYHDFPAYITACAEQIKNNWSKPHSGHKLILSYHGLPQSFVEKGDPYFDQCIQTSALIAAKLGLNEGDYISTFQSRFGKAEWLKPYTEQTLKSLPAADVKSVDLFCPGFSADCLETLEEIANENKRYFLQSGGEQFRYIAALNSQSLHIDALHQLVELRLKDWHNGI